MEAIYENILQARQSHRKAVLCIVVAIKGSAPGKPGAKMLVYDNGEIMGSIGGGKVEKRVIEDALEQLKSNEPKLFKHDLLKDLQMSCGGSMHIYIEPIMKNKQLYIFGAGHIGQALANFASSLQFELFIIDDRVEYLDQVEIKGVNKIHGNFKDILASLSFDKDSYIAIMTYEHSCDRDILAHCVKQNFAYLGMIGSQRKIEITKKDLLGQGIATPAELTKVDMPMGLKIKVNTPEEIAISVVAKIIDIKNSPQV